MPDKYAVVGNPVAHSFSPKIHSEFARQTGQDIGYTAILVPPDGFDSTVRKFRDEDGKGLNITLPFKHEAWRLAGVLQGDALGAGAVNTMDFRDGKIIGHNTDGIGLVTDLVQNQKFSIDGKRVLILGAGGAAYGVIQPVLKAHPESAVVANRTLTKATRMIAHFHEFSGLAARGISARSYDQLAGTRFDLVINATSAGLNDEMPPCPPGIFAEGALAYDMVYGKQTPFMNFASGQGSRTCDGLGMLVEQAAASFFIWRGVRPQTAPVIAMLKAQNRGSGIED